MSLVYIPFPAYEHLGLIHCYTLRALFGEAGRHFLPFILKKHAPQEKGQTNNKAAYILKTKNTFVHCMCVCVCGY